MSEQKSGGGRDYLCERIPAELVYKNVPETREVDREEDTMHWSSANTNLFNRSNMRK